VKYFTEKVPEGLNSSEIFWMCVQPENFNEDLDLIQS
jgi:hypothetical protein